MNKDRDEYEPVAGMLQHLNGKVLVVKDFTVVLTTREEQRQEIFSQLRAIYDGYYEKAFGTLPEPIRVKAEMGLILAVTPAIDIYTKAHITLGERFLKVRTHSRKQESPVKKALKGVGRETAARTRRENAVAHYLETLTFTVPNIPEKYETKLVKLAQYTAIMRTYVHAQFYRGDIVWLDLPSPEFATRLVKQLYKLGQLLTIIRNKDEFGDEEYETLKRVAIDTTDQTRQKIIELFFKNLNGEYTVYSIAQEINTHWRTTKTHLERIAALEIVEADYTIDLSRYYVFEFVVILLLWVFWFFACFSDGYCS